MAEFAPDVPGLTPIHRHDGWAVFHLESGDRDLFEVDHLVEARAELLAAGVEIVADTVWATEAFADPGLEGFGWLLFRAPDGHIQAMQRDHAPEAPGERGHA